MSGSAKQRGYHKKYQLRRRALLDGLKNRSCLDCGGTFPPECMDFDHVSGTKLFSIGTKACNVSLERLAAEAEKCEVVCANCHRKRTRRRA